MAGGEWERLATAIIIPALQQAAAELNERDDIVAECCDYPFGWRCVRLVDRPPYVAIVVPVTYGLVCDSR